MWLPPCFAEKISFTSVVCIVWNVVFLYTSTSYRLTLRLGRSCSFIILDRVYNVQVDCGIWFDKFLVQWLVWPRMKSYRNGTSEAEHIGVLSPRRSKGIERVLVFVESNTIVRIDGWYPQKLVQAMYEGLIRPYRWSHAHLCSVRFSWKLS